MENQEQKKSGPKPKGWFSRRHETSEAHNTASVRYQTEHGRAARQRKAKERVDPHYLDRFSLAELVRRLGECDLVRGRGVEERRVRIEDAIERKRIA